MHKLLLAAIAALTLSASAANAQGFPYLHKPNETSPSTQPPTNATALNRWCKNHYGIDNCAAKSAECDTTHADDACQAEAVVFCWNEGYQATRLFACSEFEVSFRAQQEGRD
jgi:hypothetical protein